MSSLETDTVWVWCVRDFFLHSCVVGMFMCVNVSAHSYRGTKLTLAVLIDLCFIY